MANENAAAKNFASFVVLDLETNTLPWLNGYRVSITEMSLYGFGTKYIKAQQSATSELDSAKTHKTMPKNPRVLHKLNLLFNPQARIDPTAEKITGLDNYQLEYESPFNKNAANMLISFLEHLPQPVCLVAHNGWFFDFPIVKQVLDKLNKQLPIGTCCLDSLIAFLEIDKQRQINAQLSKAAAAAEKEDLSSADTSIDDNDMLKRQALNETTPKRRPSSELSNAKKRQILASGAVDIAENEAALLKRSSVGVALKSKRSLFPPATQRAPYAKPKHLRKVFPPKGVYKLDAMYERIFGNPLRDAHNAEADVQALCKLMLHYGNDFLDYAEEHAAPFEQIIHLREMR